MNSVYKMVRLKVKTSIKKRERKKEMCVATDDSENRTEIFRVGSEYFVVIDGG